MKRRAALLATAAVLLSSALPLSAQRAGRIYRVGFVMGGTPESEDARRFSRAFLEGMKERGYEEGRNFVLAMRHYGIDRQKLAPLADELIAWEPDVLVANVSSTAAVLQKRTATIPIVMVTSLDVVGEGLVASLARPGGNITGMTSLGDAMDAKLVELIRELLPRAKRFALLVNPAQALSKSREAAAAQAAKALALEMVPLHLNGGADVARFAKRLSAERVDALLVATDAVLFGLRDKVVLAALEARLPVVALLPEFIASGAVATLGYDLAANYRGAARYVDRILKGARPGELPIEQPTQFELVLNLKAAKALGLAVPSSVLVRAGRVIE